MSGEPDRRAFLRRAALGSAAAAAGSLFPDVALAGELALAAAGAPAVVWKRTPCAFCGVGCGLLVGIENGRAVAVRGDPDSPVNRGLACVKGYHSVQALYGRDRLTRALVRRAGRLTEVPMREALDLVAARLRATIGERGKDAIALFGSGQWTIPEGYLAAKLFKGALGTNNVDADARLASGSAASGLVSTFGMDGAVGCYEDIEHADVFVLWGGNLAESHPVLFSRLLEQRRKRPGVRIVDLATRTTRTSYAADRSLLFAPHSELAIANAVCHELVARNWVNADFVSRHVTFHRGRTGIGDDDRVQERSEEVDWDEYVGFLARYAPERAAEISGIAAADIRWLAALYGDPALRVTSLWSAGLNQHARGTWANNLLYNIHLLVGKIAAPGNSPFPLAEHPSAWGSVHDVGAAPEGLPAGTVGVEADRRHAAEVWSVPAERIDDEPGGDALSLFRALDRGDVRFLWIQAADPMLELPNLARYREAARAEDRFLVVSAAYPTPTTDVADVVLPSALWIEREGVFGSAERRTQHFERMLEPPGDALDDGAQPVEVARRLGFQDLFPTDSARMVDEVWAEYGRFRESAARRLPALAEAREGPGLLWPYVDGRETRWRYNAALDPAADSGRGEFDFYGTPDHRARVWLRPYEPPAEPPDEDFPFWLSTGAVLEHSWTGSLTRRIPLLHRAVPAGYVEVNAQDAEELGIRDRDRVRLTSRRGSLEVEARVDYRAQPARGGLFAPTFDEAVAVNTLTLDALDPLSGQPDPKCAVRIERVRPG
jgi:nitrate reductase NapA